MDSSVIAQLVKILGKIRGTQNGTTSPGRQHLVKLIMTKPPCFHAKKYLLLGLVFATTGLLIFFIILFASKINNQQLKQNSEPLRGEFKPLTNTLTMGRTALIVLIAVFVLFILIQLLGVISAVRENFGATCTYVILQFATTVVNFILITFYGSILWAAAGWCLAVLVFALVYLRDLYLIYMEQEMQHQQQQQQQMHEQRMRQVECGAGEHATHMNTVH